MKSKEFGIVPSQTSMGLTYEVRLIDSTWVCTCPDFENREIEAYKHIFGVKFWIATNTYLQEKPKPKVFAEDAIQCDRCGSIRVIRYGKSASKQAYYCNDCKHKFTPSLIKKAKYSPEGIFQCKAYNHGSKDSRKLKEIGVEDQSLDSG